MSSGTRHDPDSVKKLILGMTSKLTSGGHKVEDVAQAMQRISRLGMSPRQMMLNRLWSFYKCEAYSARKVDWNGREVIDPIEHEAIAHGGNIPPGFYDAGENFPIKFRKPTAPYALVKVIVDRFTGLLFSDKHHPTVRVDGDPNTEDFLQAIVREGRLWPQMIQARTFGGATGSFVVGFQFIDGEIEFEVHDPRWCEPTFKDRSELILESIDKRYMYPLDEKDSEGRYTTNWYWYRRLINEEFDVLFEPVPVEDGSDPQWVEKRTINHNFGFCPVVWGQNLPVQDDIDGDPDAVGIYDTVEAIDALMSQANKGILATCDPTLILITDAQMADIKSGSDNAIKLPNGGSAHYLELSGTGPRAALELAEIFRKQALEVAQCVLEHPDVANRTATEVERVYSGMLTKAGVMREQYGSKAIKPLLEMVLKAAAKLLKGYIDEETGFTVREEIKLQPKMQMQEDGTVVPVNRTYSSGGNVRLQWPKYFERTLADVELATRSAIAAKTGSIIDQEHAVKYISEYFGVEDVHAMMANIEMERDREQDALASQALGMLGAPGIPSGPEEQEEEDIDEDEEGMDRNPEGVEEEDLPPSMSAEEAAEMLGVSKNSINRAIKNGKLPGTKVGNKYVLLRKNLMDWMGASPVQ